VIDPNQCVGELLAQTLHSHGYVVTLVTEYPPWFACAEPAQAEVVLLDPLLPSWEQGLAVCREIRERSGVPVLLVTSRYLEDDIREALVAGAAGVICKPFSPMELVARLEAVLSQRCAPAACGGDCRVGRLS
jgi:DNA-binding response OmpR family regulator